MPRLIEKKDRVRAVASVGSADRVWFESIMARNGSLSFSIPENGMYQVILVKLDPQPKVAPKRRKQTRDSIGFDRKCNSECHSTLFETLRSCPFGGVELNVERDQTMGRQVSFA